MKATNSFWSMPAADLLKELGSGIQGLNNEEATLRKNATGKNKGRSAFTKDFLLFFRQFKNPLVLLLVFALILSLTAGTYTDCIIIFCILFLSGTLGFIQERNAGRAAEKLRAMVQIKAHIRRNNEVCDVAIEDVVPGDILLLKAGDIVPADGLIIESTDLYVNESVLTGESYPSEKKATVLARETALIKRTNSVYKGTSVVSGTAIVVIAATGKESELGKIETELGSISEETAFEKGINHFGYMLMRVALLMAGTILIINVSMGRPALDSVLYALALSIGLTPELLPAIVTITLSAGAKRLASKKVIVKKLSAIQNLGSIDVLCSDKTGTLTEGEVKIHSCVSADGKECQLASSYAYLNAFFESGYSNPMDEAIRTQLAADIKGYTKCDEVPYDFIRKRLSIVVAKETQHLMITKGALKNVMEVCDKIWLPDGSVAALENYREKTLARLEEYSSQGFRTIGICYKDVTDDPIINKDDECNMVFLGFILLHDPLKQNIRAVIDDLKSKQVELKIITGDNTLIAKNIASQIGISSDRIISGPQLNQLTDDALAAKVDNFDIFSETEPLLKERIVRALQQKGHVVGYLGDGINDASALKAADVGISVNNAVDVAKESADIILLEKELHVIGEGIIDGRKTYLNTMKYVLITVSANFGNMFSMAIASMFLPFLPLLASQILLINFLTDLPALAISSDSVDAELLQKPRKWDIKLIRRFMMVFGLESSIFDLMTFGALIWMFHSSAEVFRTAWFVESVITEVLILLIIRTRRTFFTSMPGKVLTLTSILVVACVLILPYTKVASMLGFIALPFHILFTICVITILYAILGEITKKIVFRKMNY